MVNLQKASQNFVLYQHPIRHSGILRIPDITVLLGKVQACPNQGDPASTSMTQSCCSGEQMPFLRVHHFATAGMNLHARACWRGQGSMLFKKASPHRVVDKTTSSFVLSTRQGTNPRKAELFNLIPDEWLAYFKPAVSIIFTLYFLKLW